MSISAVKRKADVATSEIKSGIFAGQQNHWSLRVGRMMTGTGFGHVDDRRVIKHCTIALGNGFESAHQGFDLFHMMGLNNISHIVGTSSRISSTVANCVYVGLLSILGQGCDLCTKIINRVSHDIG